MTRIVSNYISVQNNLTRYQFPECKERVYIAVEIPLLLISECKTECARR